MTPPLKYSWMEDITEVDQLPPKFQPLAVKIGVRNTLLVMQEFEGEDFYCNKLLTAFESFWHARLKNEWRKHNLKELAHKYDLTERHVRRIVNDHEHQIDLFPKD